jgi:hypothetical protein
MTVSFNPGSATLTIDNPRPTALDPVVDLESPNPISSIGDLLDNLRILIQGNMAWFASTTCAATGTVTLTGAAGDDASGWELGFLQAQRIETNWGWYKADWTSGAAMKHGSLLLQRGKRPARTQQVCRDIGDGGPVTQIWYARSLNATGSAGAFPQTLTATFNDTPGDAYPALVMNSKTNQFNFLRAAQLEFHFGTALALREPSGRFHFLKHFYWNLIWQATFQPAAFGNAWHGAWQTPVTVGMDHSPHVSRVFDGEPSRSDFPGNIFTSTTETQTANDVFRAATRSVLTHPFIGRREEVDRDAPFDVRR